MMAAKWDRGVTFGRGGVPLSRGVAILYQVLRLSGLSSDEADQLACGTSFVASVPSSESSAEVYL